MTAAARPMPPVIVALDEPDAAAALALVDRLDQPGAGFKVGLQALTAAGPDLVRTLVARGHPVFLDLKLHEIPNSVAGAVHAAGALGASMVTVHASAGAAVLRTAVAAAADHAGLQVLALTVITSLTDADLPAIGLAPDVRGQARRLASLAADAGCHGVVASAHELAELRAVLPPEMARVVPGIQLPGGAATDQARTATPAAARAAGASHVIIGRAIARAADPRAAWAQALAAMASARPDR